MPIFWWKSNGSQIRKKPFFVYRLNKNPKFESKGSRRKMYLPKHSLPFFSSSLVGFLSPKSSYKLFSSTDFSCLLKAATSLEHQTITEQDTITEQNKRRSRIRAILMVWQKIISRDSGNVISRVRVAATHFFSSFAAKHNK